MNGKPVCMNRFPCACSLNFEVIDRTTQRSSAQEPICGNRSLTGSPLFPRFRNGQ